jgi:hypothetical protein
MLVSNFSLGVYYSQSPIKWRAQYTLQITNLAPMTIEFDIECRITRYYFGGVDPKFESPDESLSSMLGGVWSKDAKGYYQQKLLSIGANSSELYRLWPSPGAIRQWSPYVDGYVVLRVPVVRSRQPPYGLVPQTKKPVPVLLSATREDESYKYYSTVDLMASAQSSLPLATGKAYNEITPETEPYTHPIAIANYVDELLDGEVKISPAKGAIGLSEEDRAQALIDLLRQVDSNEADIRALNRMLEGSESRLRVVASEQKPQSERKG